MRIFRVIVMAGLAVGLWLVLGGALAGAQTGYGDDVAPPRVLGIQIEPGGDAGPGGGGDGGISGTTTLILGGAAALALLGGAAVYASGGIGSLHLPGKRS